MNDIYDVLEHVLKANSGAGVTLKQIQEIMFMTYGYSYEDTRRAQEAYKGASKPNYWVDDVNAKSYDKYGKASLNSATPSDWDAVRPDMVNSPPHYTKGGIEVIDFIQAKLSPEEYRGYLRGNLLKYASRLGEKDSDDAGKAAWYAQRLEML
jgi:hypothetical protein